MHINNPNISKILKLKISSACISQFSSPYFQLLRVPISKPDKHNHAQPPTERDIVVTLRMAVLEVLSTLATVQVHQPSNAASCPAQHQVDLDTVSTQAALALELSSLDTVLGLLITRCEIQSNSNMADKSVLCGRINCHRSPRSRYLWNPFGIILELRCFELQSHHSARISASLRICKYSREIYSNLTPPRVGKLLRTS